MVSKDIDLLFRLYAKPEITVLLISVPYIRNLLYLSLLYYWSEWIYSTVGIVSVLVQD